MATTERQSHIFRPMHGLKIEDLHCYGCAHAASGHPYPGRPSGERPCCFCVRNTEREDWIKQAGVSTERATKMFDNKGNPRDFNPFAGNLYNGAPARYNPMDNYITLDHMDQDDWLNQNPDYAKPVKIVNGAVIIIDD